MATCDKIYDSLCDVFAVFNTSTNKSAPKKAPFEFSLGTLFNALNKNYFNSGLNGIKVGWVNQLKLNTAICIESRSKFSKQTFIGLSIPLLKGCTRKQVLESLMYEMIYVYISMKMANIIEVDDKAKQTQAMFKRAMNFINKTSGLHLSFNYPLRAHNIIESFNKWIEIDDGVTVNQLNDTVICISDDDSDCDDVDEDGGDNFRLISQKITLQAIDEYSHPLQEPAMLSVICCCCTDYDTVFKKYFEGTKFGLITTNDDAPIKCPTCCQTLEGNNLNAHLNECATFRN